MMTLVCIYLKGIKTLQMNVQNELDKVDT